MTNIIRRKVSQNRKRLVDGKFDLDLTYICDNIIAMGYPSDKPLQSLIRNKIEKVSKFLKERHENSFKIFNLCQESDYNFLHFDNMVEIFPIEDHNPPKFEQIIDFCDKMRNWLNDKSNNVAIVHCKAGKGRTGTMISCYFIYSKSTLSALEAMNLFSQKRCKDSKGVTIPSQRRYVEYFEDYLKHNRIYKQTELELKSIKIIQPNEAKIKSLSFEVLKDRVIKIYDSNLIKYNSETNCLQHDSEENSIIISDDIKINFFNRQKECVFSVSFNTFCLIQDNKTSLDENSCLGLISYEEEKKILSWRLKKKEIDLIFKEATVNSDFEILFQFKPLHNVEIKLQDLENSLEEKENIFLSRVSKYDNVNENYNEDWRSEDLSQSFEFNTKRRNQASSVPNNLEKIEQKSTSHRNIILRLLLGKKKFF